MTKSSRAKEPERQVTQGPMKIKLWSQAEWFVKFAALKELGTLTEAEQLRWRQELAVVELKARTPILPVPEDPLRYPRGESTCDDSPVIVLPSMDEAEATLNVIRPYIVDLAEGRRVYLGPFDLRYTLAFHHIHDQYGRKNIPRYVIYRGEFHPTSFFHTSILRHLASLLEMYCDHVRRCLHCAGLFLQFRRQQRFCGRRCQSIVAARKTRIAKAKSKSSKRSHVPKQPSKNPKTGDSDGKKRR